MHVSNSLSASLNRIGNRLLLDVRMECVVKLPDPFAADGVDDSAGLLLTVHDVCFETIERLDGNSDTAAFRVCGERLKPFNASFAFLVRGSTADQRTDRVVYRTGQGLGPDGNARIDGRFQVILRTPPCPFVRVYETGVLG